MFSIKNVYFVQVDVSATMGSRSVYLPYTAGVLAAAAFSDETVRAHFTFKEFIFIREEIDDVVARMDKPSLAAFSNYCWNTEYNKRLAAAIKRKYPGCVVVFGGHNVPDDSSFLRDYSYIDILCHGEGERTAQKLMRALAVGDPLDEVPNISFRRGGDFVRTRTEAQCALDFPSPYLEGWFDKIVDENPEISFNAILETSRGCPNKCAYCDWGVLNAKVRAFPFERIQAEIRWFSAHKIAFVWGADANFGLYNRDLTIADELVRAKTETGYPERMRMNYAKDRFENVFAIVKKFKECDFDRLGATLSFQSMSPIVLKNIGRTNRDLDFYKKLLTKYNSEGMKTYSELILGLPGETYESFTEGVCALFDLGQHFVFEVYECILLPNSEMGKKAYREKHGIKTVRSEMIRPHFNETNFNIPEYNEIIVETNTMSREMWVASMVFHYLAKAFHGNGLLRVFALYLRHEMNVPYIDFYNKLTAYLASERSLFTSKVYYEITRHQTEISLGAYRKRLVFEPCGSMVWLDHEYLVLHALSQTDSFFEEMRPFLRSFGIRDDVFDDLFDYQKNILRRPDNAYAEIRLRYDVHSFLQHIYQNDPRPLMPKKHLLKLRDGNFQNNWADFGKYVLWYGKMGWASYKDEVAEEPLND